ncbi:MAG: hypothetical protein BWY76_03140 [bacterium ADurb.Bin429]|nr:MAG: hypothetical protein BWY76_03140 [bacterium ADurb.Bin429]
MTGTFFLRPPAWAPRDSVGITRNGESVPLRWGGLEKAYLMVPDVLPGDRLALTYPVPSFTQHFTPTSVPGREEPLAVRWAGNTVVGIEPHGQYLPMFTG